MNGLRFTGGFRFLVMLRVAGRARLGREQQELTQTLQKSRRAVGVSPSVHCLGDYLADRLLISPKVILRTPRANVGHGENRRAYAGRSPLAD